MSVIADCDVLAVPVSYGHSLWSGIPTDSFGDASSLKSAGIRRAAVLPRLRIEQPWCLQDGSQQDIFVQALDDQSGIAFAEEIFVDEKPTMYDFANHTPKLTGATAMAQFANEQGA